MSVAICLGGSSTAWADLEAARALAPNATIVACNHSARDIPGFLAHWVTMHPELLPMWMDERRSHGRPDAGQLWAAKHRIVPPQLVPHVRGIKSPGGSSGLLCVAVALHLGFEHIILAGIPMEANGKHYNKPMRWMEARQYLPAWSRMLPEMAGRVKSFGGETAKLLGQPTAEWLNGEHATGRSNESTASPIA